MWSKIAYRQTSISIIVYVLTNINRIGGDINGDTREVRSNI